MNTNQSKPLEASVYEALLDHTERLESLIFTDQFPQLMDDHMKQREVTMAMIEQVPVRLSRKNYSSDVANAHALDNSRFELSNFKGQLLQSRQAGSPDAWSFNARYMANGNGYDLQAGEAGAFVSSTSYEGRPLTYELGGGATRFLAAVAIQMGYSAHGLSGTVEDAAFGDGKDTPPKIDGLLRIMANLHGHYQSTTTARLELLDGDRTIMLRQIDRETPTYNGTSLDMVMDWPIDDSWDISISSHLREMAGEGVRERLCYAERGCMSSFDQEAVMLFDGSNGHEARVIDPEDDGTAYMQSCTAIMSCLQPVLDEVEVTPVSIEQIEPEYLAEYSGPGAPNPIIHRPKIDRRIKGLDEDGFDSADSA